MKKWDLSNIKNWTWREPPIGGIIPEAATADDYPTGGWRTQRPVRDDNICNQCLICFIVCPDAAILAEDDKITDIRLHHCKGCGICAVECPVDAIKMVDESAASDERGVS